MFVYHVTHQDTGNKKLITVNSKVELMNEITKKFACDSSSIFIQYHTNIEGIGEVWLDMDKPEDLPDQGKLLLVTTVNGATEQSQSNLLSSPPLPSLESEEVAVNTTANGAKTTHLTFYRLPKFPRDVQERLDTKDVQLITDRAARSKVIRILYDDLLEKVGWYVLLHVLSLYVIILINLYVGL